MSIKRREFIKKSATAAAITSPFIISSKVNASNSLKVWKFGGTSRETEYWPVRNKVFSNKRDIIVADSLLELFRIRENIENFNKKALYILIRERTGLKTQNITKVVNKMKKDFAQMFITYQKSGNLIRLKS